MFLETGCHLPKASKMEGRVETGYRMLDSKAAMIAAGH